MIYLWHSDKGVPFYRDSEGAEELGQRLVLAITEKAPELLLPRERRPLTSGFVNERFFEHVVHVSEDGEQAIFTVLSIRFNAVLLGGNLVFLPETDVNDFMRVILPDQRPYMMVAFPGEEPGMVRIVDLVYYYPEKMQTFLDCSFSRNEVLRRMPEAFFE